MELSGRVVTGTGQAAGFTELIHAKQQFLEKLGIDAWPGTLNIKIEDKRTLANWQSLRNKSGIDIKSPDGNNCHARSYPVHINHRITGAIIFPEISGYPADQVEIITSVPLRKHLSLNDGDRLRLDVIDPVRVSNILFDLDGTLVDTVGAFYLLAKTTGAEFGLEVSRAGMYETLNNGISYWHHVVPVSAENRQGMIHKLNNRAMELWPDVFKAHACAFPNVYDTLSGLSASGYRLGIVTGSGERSLELLYRQGTAGLFDAVVTGADVEQRKPDPEGLLKCLGTMDADPADTVYVGDSVIDMQASHAAGVVPIGVLTGAGTSASLCQAGAYRIISSHRQLAGLLASTLSR